MTENSNPNTTHAEPEEILFAVTHLDEDGNMSTEFHMASDELAAAFKHTCVKWVDLSDVNETRAENEQDPLDPDDFDFETLQEFLRDGDCDICVAPVPTTI